MAQGAAKRHRGTAFGSVLALCLGVAVPPGAQQPPVRLTGQIEPYIGSLSRDFPVLGLAVRARHPIDSTARPAYARELYVGAGATFKGGWRVQAHLRAPRLGSSHRLTVAVSAADWGRFLFTGLGNDTEFDRSIEKDPQPNLFSVRRQQAELRVDATRWIGAGFGLSLGLRVEGARFTALPGPSVFRAGFGESLRETDAAATVIALYDRRDSETIPTRGLLIQAGAQLGGATGWYHRWFGVAQGYAPLGRGTVLALRGVVAALAGDPPLVARLQLPTWERPLELFGGDASLRGLRGQRLIGAAAWLANAELHRDLVVVRGHTLSVVAFVDGGRVFEDEAFRITAGRVKANGGIAVALRGTRERVGAALAAVGPDGLRLSVLSGWTF